MAITCACGEYTVEQVVLDRGRGAGPQTLLRVRQRVSAGSMVTKEFLSVDALGAFLADAGHGLDDCPANR
jgi:hypothetical protein